MMQDRVDYYYNLCDMNCAETVLHCANDEFGLNLPPESYKAIAGFGAGIGCEKFCGALAGAIAAIGIQHIEKRAHATEGFPARCAAFITLAEQELGSLECGTLKEKYRTEQTRCIQTIRLAAELLERAESCYENPKQS